ncbi:MAG: hypothetical protein JW918_03665 [Anaerolineae bacterium]|nr:hypothetical protein [Anaerolineae bacterium]
MNDLNNWSKAPTRNLIVSLLLATAALVALGLIVSSRSVSAQAGDIYVDKQLGRPSPVVHVGEYLTFTIYIRNDSAFTVTTLPLSDTYNTVVLGFADATPPPDNVNEGAGRLDWNDLTDYFGDLPPGASIVVVVGFIAEHPETAVVNAAEVHDALGTGGALSGTNSILTNTTSVGGSSPVEKDLLEGLIPQVGLPLTFTITITNNGFTTMTVVPLVDTYNPAWMAFNYAVPAPDIIDEVNGELTWSDLTDLAGDIPPHGTVTVTTVFTALTSGDATNSAEVSGASDWYENELTGGSDLVPITIIEGPTPTPTAAPTSVPATRQPAPTAAPDSTATPGSTPTNTVIPLLPQSGKHSTKEGRGNASADLLVLGVGGVGLGAWIAALACMRRRKQ